MTSSADALAATKPSSNWLRAPRTHLATIAVGHLLCKVLQASR
jgi:hypothetical protein